MTGWKEKGGTSRFPQVGERKRIKILAGERWDRLRTAGEIFQNVDRKVVPRRAAPKHLGKTNGLLRR